MSEPNRPEPLPYWLKHAYGDAARIFRQSKITSTDFIRLRTMLLLIESDDLPIPAIDSPDGRTITATWLRADRELVIRVRDGNASVSRSHGSNVSRYPLNTRSPDAARLVREQVRIFFGREVNRSTHPEMVAEILAGGREG